MRVPGALFALIICVSGGAATAQSGHNGRTSSAGPTSHCPRSQSYLAVQRMGRSLAPRKLTELPPATTYMAVLRQIGGCDVPLTMAKYRGSVRP